MAPDWNAVRALFERVVELAPADRAAALAEACGDDDELLRGVRALLDADDDLGTQQLIFERELDLEAAAAAAPSEMIGQHIAGYEVRGVLGVGGMGAVFAAVQDHPQRTVALKTMRFGMWTPAARRRFEYETEVLARLQHPAIAQVYEAGTWNEPVSGAELPFFAMEFVAEARPLDQYVRDERLGLHSMLELFLEVCDGLQHGHQQGVIHRDLKPHNILVDAQGHPKIIDFGIARATDSDGEPRTRLTGAGQVLGTLDYMAPEQFECSANSNDVRVDVYAMGAVLYQLLAGEPPFAQEGSDSAAVLIERIRTEEPVAPSRRGSRFDLRGEARELDWITARALAKDPRDRYVSLSELSDDLRRFTRHEPIVAGPPSASYRLRKFVRRHRVLVAGAAAVTVALFLGIAGTTWQMYEAEHQATRVQGVNDFYNQLLGFANPIERPILTSNPDVTMREALDAAAQKLEAGDLGVAEDEPLIEADVRMTIATAYRTHREAKKARKHYQRALELRRAELGEQHPDVAVTLHHLASLYASRGSFDQAEEMHREAIEIYRVTEPDGLGMAHSVGGLAATLMKQRRVDDAMPLMQEAVERYRDLGSDYYLGIELSDVAFVQNATGDSDAAIGTLREALAAFERAGVPWHAFAASAHRQLAEMIGTADVPAARRHAETAVELFERQVGNDNGATVRSRQVLAALLIEAEDLDAAEQQIRAALAGARKAYGEHAGSTLGAWSQLGDVQRQLDKLPEAESALLRVMSSLDDRDPAVVARSLGGERYAQMLRRATLERLRDVYAAWEKPEEQARVEARLDALK